MSRGSFSEYPAYEPTYGQPVDLVGGFASVPAPPYRLPHKQPFYITDEGEELYRELPENSDGQTWDERDQTDNY